MDFSVEGEGLISCESDDVEACEPECVRAALMTDQRVEKVRWESGAGRSRECEGEEGKSCRSGGQAALASVPRSCCECSLFFLVETAWRTSRI